MTLYKPSLFVKRLIVIHNGKRAYDESYHLGVNIICGENSSGKSTITELLFYSLGGEIARWKTEASQCEYVFCEVIINGTTITLKREISTQSRRPLEIFWGPFEDAVHSAVDQWQIYPFQRSESKDSFSQCLFRTMEMPEVRGDKSTNITMHQILRLIYCDQMTPPDRLFRMEQFDSSLHRMTIGDLLCGIYSSKLYEKQLLLEEKTKLFDALQHKLKSIYSILGEADQETTLASLEDKIVQLQSERVFVYEELKKMKESSFLDSANSAKTDLKNVIYSDLIQIRSEISILRNKKEELEFEIEDTTEFINTIKDRILALSDSNVVRSTFEEMNFQFCPSCLAPIDKSINKGICGLCKSPAGDKKESAYYLMLQQEMELQVKESQALQINRIAELQQINLTLPSKMSHEEELALKIKSYEESINNETENQIEELNRKIGYLDRSIQDAHERAKLLSLIKDITDEKSRVNGEISLLNDDIEAMKEEIRHKKEVAYYEIANLTKDLLKRDLDREKEFQFADIVSFNFGDDNISVDGKRQFSASSMVYLKNSFHLAFIWASTIQNFFNYPRLAVFDNIEDKGTEQKRSHNFQKIIIEISEQMKVQHQIIFATSMIMPELKKSSLIIGDYYTHNHKSLNFS